MFVIDDKSAESIKDFNQWLSIFQNIAGRNLSKYPFLLVRIASKESVSSPNETLISEKVKWFNDYFECTFTKKQQVDLVFQEMARLVISIFSANNNKIEFLKERRL